MKLTTLHTLPPLPAACMRASIAILFTILTGFLVTPAAGTLTKVQRTLRDSLLEVYPLEYCCGTTLGKCLETKKKCSIAHRLETFLTWLVGTDPDPDPVKVLEQLDLRYNGFTTGERITFDTSHCQVTGPRDAPIVLMVYVSALCPSCKRYVGDLRNAILADTLLHGRVAIIPKPSGGGIGNIALVAAAQEGRFWELFFAYRHVHSIFKDTSDIIPIAAKAGILTERFIKLLSAPATRQLLEKNRKEGKRNEVNYLPGYFINGKPYSSYTDTRWIIDALHFELEQIQPMPPEK